MKPLAVSADQLLRTLRVPITPLREGLLQLDRPTSHYLIDVHRLAAGVHFLAFDAEAGTQAQATLVTSNSRGAACRVEAVEASRLIPQYRTVVVQAFGKGTRVDQVVRDATALDATEIWVVSTLRSAVPNPTEMRGRCERWRKIALESARQCVRGNVPRIEGVVSLREALHRLADYPGIRCVLSPHADSALCDALAPGRVENVMLLVGPEGGLDESEIELSTEFGFRQVRLGLRVLRTEVATVVSLGVIAALRDREQVG